MTISEILRRHPESFEIFRRHGLDCYGCQIAEFEELERGAQVHKVDVEALLKELNEAEK